MKKRLLGSSIWPIVRQQRLIVKVQTDLISENQEFLAAMIKAGLRCFELQTPMSIDEKQLHELSMNWKNAISKIVDFKEIILGVRADLSDYEKREAFRHLCYGYFICYGIDHINWCPCGRADQFDHIPIVSTLSEVYQVRERPFKLFIPSGVNRLDYLQQLRQEINPNLKVIIDLELYNEPEWQKVAYFFDDGLFAATISAETLYKILSTYYYGTMEESVRIHIQKKFKDISRISKKSES